MSSDVRSWLIQGFEYDLWANRRWASCLATPRMREVFDHISFANRIWLSRVGPTVEGDALETLARAWIERVGSQDLDRIVEYRNLSGQEQTRTFGEIARHVINHGAYHRGQLRQLAEDAGANWPETDMHSFFVEPPDA